MATDIFEFILGELVELQTAYFLYAKLFEGPQEQLALMDRVDGLFNVLQRILRDSIILGIARLLDPRSRHYKTSSFESAIAELGVKQLADLKRIEFQYGSISPKKKSRRQPLPDTKLAGIKRAELKRSLDGLRTQCEPLLKERDKRIAHNEAVVMGRPSSEGIKKAIDDATDFNNKLRYIKELDETPLSTDIVSCAGLGYDRFFRILQFGFEREEAERTTRRDEDRRKRNVQTRDDFDPESSSNAFDQAPD